MISLKRYLEKPAHKLFSSREPNTTSAVRNIKLSGENGFQGIEESAHMTSVAIKSEICRGSWQAGNS